ncbi:SOS response associated peptidase (SRAP) domain-containing protein [Hirsutella rhossiliensis]|uniref:SOS response associated peptidase (SRAP) domain-containing protein n=1 Tax=Hirsutella rhossiliensis TaxID=111463 RepID=A0A9P8N6H5_9HYPO|nr:SOS response associated peptidase (SRAP) domain-containing protein [Hirsutella rhossiliensis]KAH0967447.1 SOS response associated peptidase (SRAP) domain-containing protein [Hirsutella rhossiliensis]
MCGRYALALGASQVRQMLEDDDMPVADAPDDDGAGAPRNSYNFAPGYHGIVYRAATPDWGAGPRPHAGHDDNDDNEKPPLPADVVTYRLQAMKWGLIPFWTKRNPDYSSVMRTINCRDDSLSTPGGMWATMKARKRCIVVAQGFYEWLKTGPRDKLPHYVKRKDGRLMCFAGLWDCVQYEGSEEKTYTYTIITTDSNKQLKFLHDRMPVILDPGSDKIKAWLDPTQHEWTRGLQSLLRPFDGALDVYPVSKDVGKVGNNSPSFIIPLDSKENKCNIANFFSNAQQKKEAKEEGYRDGDHGDVSKEKRKAAPTGGDSPPLKKFAVDKKKISSTKNEHRSPVKSKDPRSQKITKFFGNSA